MKQANPRVIRLIWEKSTQVHSSRSAAPDTCILPATCFCFKVSTYFLCKFHMEAKKTAPPNRNSVAHEGLGSIFFICNVPACRSAPSECVSADVRPKDGLHSMAFAGVQGASHNRQRPIERHKLLHKNVKPVAGGMWGFDDFSARDPICLPKVAGAARGDACPQMPASSQIPILDLTRDARTAMRSAHCP